MAAAVVFQVLTSALAGPMALPGCPESCGDISVPYPFGIGEGCFYEGFNLTCDRMHRPPKLLLGDGLEVLDISLPDGTVRIVTSLFQSDTEEFYSTWSGSPADGPFMVSSMYNWFVAYGCNILAQLIPLNPHDGLGHIASTCGAVCMSGDSLSTDEANSVCSPVGNCRASIIQSVPSYVINVTKMVSAATDSQDEGNVVAFIVEKTWFSMYGADIDLGTPGPRPPAIHGKQRFVLQTVPLVLEWSFDSEWACVGSNPVNFIAGGKGNQVRRRCSCSEGYDGNPYLANGCQDIDECQQPAKFPCHGTCINVPGTYRCSSRMSLPAKVSDFGASRSIAIDETGILTAIQGTHGYLDPEYYYTSRLTEKSDVYGFGVILAELLTRVKPLFHSHSSEITSLASYFVSQIRENRLADILDPQIVVEGGAEDAEVVARLAEACLGLKGEERPTMRQVETALEGIQGSKVTSQITRTRKNAPNDQSYAGSKGVEGTRVYSLEKEFIQSSEIPR